MVRLSKSKIGVWEKCPYLYKLLYLDEVLEESPKNEAMKRGIRIHEVFSILSSSECMDEKVFVKTAKAMLDAEENKEAIINLLKFNRRWGFPVFCEEKIEDEEYNIVGVIDRVSVKDGKLVLWDYKSGQSHPISKYRFELALYTYLFEKKFGRKVDFWGIYFLDKDKEVVEPVDRGEITKALDKVLGVREEIEGCCKSNKFIKKPGFGCMHCTALELGLCSGEAEDEDNN